MIFIEEKDQFIWFHHTWKHEKLTHINDRISLISSTKQNLDFAEVICFVFRIIIFNSTYFFE